MASVATEQSEPNGGSPSALSIRTVVTPTISPGEPKPGLGLTAHRMNSPWTISPGLGRGFAKHNPITSSPGGLMVVGGNEGRVDGKGLVDGEGLVGGSPQHPQRMRPATSRPTTTRTILVSCA
jgi:hypothetical protein